MKSPLLALFTASLLTLPVTAQAAILTLTDFQAVLSSSTDPASGNTTVSLLMDSRLFGAGGIAGGTAEIQPPDPVQPPQPVRWLVDPFGPTPPDDSMPAISFLFDATGVLMGADDPFRIFMSDALDDSIIGLLDFSSVSGSLGSINLSGVQVLGVDAAGGLTGEVLYDIEPFTLQAVPVPAAFILFGSGLLGLLGMAKRKR